MTISKKEPEEVPEVQDFLNSSKVLQDFIKQNRAFYDEFNELVADYNQKLEAAEKVCRQQSLSCGPFDLYSQREKWDYKGLFDRLGRDRFLQVGGKLSTQTVYDGDGTKLNKSAELGLIPTDVADECRSETNAYHKPKKAELP